MKFDHNQKSLFGYVHLCLLYVVVATHNIMRKGGNYFIEEAAAFLYIFIPNLKNRHAKRKESILGKIRYVSIYSVAILFMSELNPCEKNHPLYTLH